MKESSRRLNRAGDYCQGIFLLFQGLYTGLKGAAVLNEQVEDSVTRYRRKKAENERKIVDIPQQQAGQQG